MDAVTDASFDADVLQSGRPVVVDFWAPWCGPCKAVAPVLEALAAEQPGIAFVKVDIDANPAVASRLGILSIPTVMVFDGGELKASVVGARPRGHFEKVLAPWLASG